MVCSTCRLTLPVSEYGLTHREGGRGYRSSCKKCLNEKRADRQLRDACEQNGITLDDYQEILKRQGGVCAICRTSDCGPVARRFSIDHCHKTGKVRGLLCHRCNLGIGHFDDSIELLRVAIAYLTEGGG
jgi:hypothetical protein